MSVTLLLIAITAAASFYAWSHPEMQSKWLFNAYQVKKNKEYWRFLTSGLIHADLGHLFFNMFSLYCLGEFVEAVFNSWFGPSGMIYYVALYLIGIVVSEIPSYFKHQKDYNYNSLGASGGVSSVIFSSIIIAPTTMLRVNFIPVPAIVFGILYLVFSHIQSKRNDDNVNHDAHFYGAVFGIIYTVVINYGVIFDFAYQISHWKLF